jgi:hypothetical protein
MFATIVEKNVLARVVRRVARLRNARRFHPAFLRSPALRWMGIVGFQTVPNGTEKMEKLI